MARQENIISVFVASPSDVREERNKLEEIIQELNISWSRELNIRLELIMWETHAHPDIGVDAQDVINRQVPGEWDIFIGIMWHRFGTKTGRFDSGTLEEFERAKSTRQSDNPNMNIMFYFKESAISPSKLDPDQLSKVNTFRTSLGEEGVLHWPFDRLEQFETLARMHLTRCVQSWSKRLGSSDGGVRDDQLCEFNSEEEEELGVFDLLDLMEEKFEEVTNVLDIIGEEMETLTHNITKRAEQFVALPRDRRGNADRKVARHLLTLTASDMDRFTSRTESELPRFNEALSSSMGTFIKIIPLLEDFEQTPSQVEDLNSTLGALTTLETGIENAIGSMSGFQSSVDELPRLTSEVNKSRRALSSICERIVSEFENGKVLLLETRAVLDDFVNSGG